MTGSGVFPDWLQSLLLLLFIGLAIVLAFQQASELKKLQRSNNKKIYTIIHCGEKEHTRQFQEGDYIGAKVQCNGEEGRIVKIYAVIPEEQGKKPMKT